jgi:hypothetical protein
MARRLHGKYDIEVYGWCSWGSVGLHTRWSRVRVAAIALHNFCKFSIHNLILFYLPAAVARRPHVEIFFSNFILFTGPCREETPCR